MENIILNESTKDLLKKMQNGESNFKKFKKLKKALNIIISVVAIIAAFFTAGISIAVGIVALIVLNILLGKKAKENKSQAAEFKEKFIESAYLGTVQNVSFTDEPDFSEAEEFAGDLMNLSGKYKTARNRLTGVYNDFEFTTMDIHCFGVKKDKTMSKNNEDYYRKDLVYVEGIFTKTKFNKNINGSLIIAQDKHDLGLNNYNLDKVSMDNSKFNKIYTVFASDKTVAYSALDAVIMEKLINLDEADRPHIVIIENDRITIGQKLGLQEKQYVKYNELSLLESKGNLEKLAYMYSEDSVKETLTDEMSTLDLLYDTFNIGDRIYA